MALRPTTGMSPRTKDPTNFDDKVDTVTVDYPSGFSFNGLNENDITVTMERQLNSGPDTRTLVNRHTEVDYISDEKA